MSRVLRPVPADTEPEIGKFYDVPCVQYKSNGLFVGETAKVWLPILGHKHSDPEAAPSTPWPHYHLDFRFIADGVISRVWGWRGYPLERLMGNVVWEFWDGPSGGRCVSPDIHDIRTLRRRCTRAMPRFPLEYNGNHSALTRRVERLCAGKTVNLEKPTCPHKGFPLSGLPVDGNGCVVCPLHGLRISLVTGIIMTEG